MSSKDIAPNASIEVIYLLGRIEYLANFDFSVKKMLAPKKIVLGANK